MLRATLACLVFAPVSMAQCNPLTPAQTEGPYFKAGSPLKVDFRPDAATPNWVHLVFDGTVVGPNCLPLQNAKIDLWHANELGQYDNAPGSYKMRGHVFTNACGEFHFDTIVPGLYPGRTRHMHVKVTPAGGGGATLTTQMYFPGEPQNQTDPLYNPALEMKLTKSATQWVGTYTFIKSEAGASTCVCAADCNLSGGLNIDDFICFQTQFALGDPEADCDASGDLTIDDFICFQTLFAIGC